MVKKTPGGAPSPNIVGTFALSPDRRCDGPHYIIDTEGHLMNSKPFLSLVVSSAVIAGCISIAGCGGGNDANAQMPVFTLSSPDLASGTFATQYILNGFGCTGGNISPAVNWTNPPVGTKSFVLNVFDPDAPTGSGFWHWAVYNIPASATGLPRGAGNAAATLPAPAFGGTTDLLDTGTTGGNGNYGGPCPPAGDQPHRYIFTLYALSVDDVQMAGGVPRTGTAGLYSFALNKGIGAALLAKTTFTATYGR
jgi:Raf kinase inhibitor-like YbhB/YbcL family protein